MFNIWLAVSELHENRIEMHAELAVEVALPPLKDVVGSETMETMKRSRRLTTTLPTTYSVTESVVSTMPPVPNQRPIEYLGHNANGRRQKSYNKLLSP
jgi:hypothetical protein